MPRPLRRDLSACTADGITYSCMVGVGETYLAAFAIALGWSGVASGLLVALPPIAGGILQLSSARGVRLIGGAKPWVVLCAAVQALSLVPLAVGALAESIPTWLVFLCASVYWAAALSAGAAWNSWVGEIFPAPIRARYFGRRNRWCQLATLGGVLTGGWFLGEGDSAGRPLLGFAACFGVAAACRFASIVFLSRQGAPSRQASHRRVTILALLQRATHAADARLIVAMISFQVAVQIAQPYFNPFMLRELDYPSRTYTAMIAASFVAKSLALPIVGAIAARRGARVVLRWSAVGASLLAAVWTVSGSPAWILPSQLAAGALWAGYELAVFLLLLETIAPEERTSVMSGYYLLNATATVVGALIGGAILRGEETWTAYATVFGVSTFARIAAIPLFLRVTGDARRPSAPVLEPIAVRPSAGSIDAPIAIEGDSTEAAA